MSNTLNHPYPKRPFRAVLFLFLGLATFVSLVASFDPRLREAWPLALGYCAILAIFTIGLIRLKFRYLALLIFAGLTSILLGLAGYFVLMQSETSTEPGKQWIQASLYFGYGTGLVALVFSCWGWVSYFKEAKPGEGN